MDYDRLIVDQKVRVQISGPIPYSDDEQTMDVWMEQLWEDVSRVLRVAEGLLKDRYPQLEVELR